MTPRRRRINPLQVTLFGAIPGAVHTAATASIGPVGLLHVTLTGLGGDERGITGELVIGSPLEGDPPPAVAPLIQVHNSDEPSTGDQVQVQGEPPEESSPTRFPIDLPEPLRLLYMERRAELYGHYCARYAEAFEELRDLEAHEPAPATPGDREARARRRFERFDRLREVPAGQLEALRAELGIKLPPVQGP